MWKVLELQEPYFIIFKPQHELTHICCYGLIRSKFTVPADRWNKYDRQHFIAFSGQVVFPPVMLGHADLLVEMKTVLHMTPSSQRVLAQVERALKIYEGTLSFYCK
jgi:hypothetical protein